MKKTFRVFSIALCLVLGLCLFAACGEGGQTLPIKEVTEEEWLSAIMLEGETRVSMTAESKRDGILETEQESVLDGDKFKTYVNMVGLSVDTQIYSKEEGMYFLYEKQEDLWTKKYSDEESYLMDKEICLTLFMIFSFEDFEYKNGQYVLKADSSSNYGDIAVTDAMFEFTDKKLVKAEMTQKDFDETTIITTASYDYNATVTLPTQAQITEEMNFVTWYFAVEELMYQDNLTVDSVAKKDNVILYTQKIVKEGNNISYVRVEGGVEQKEFYSVEEGKFYRYEIFNGNLARTEIPEDEYTYALLELSNEFSAQYEDFEYTGGGAYIVKEASKGSFSVEGQPAQEVKYIFKYQAISEIIMRADKDGSTLTIEHKFSRGGSITLPNIQ